MSTSTVDWELARDTAARLITPGPQVSAQEATEITGRLRDSARRAENHVAAVTGLRASTASPVLVVDRPNWVAANTESFATLLAPLDSGPAAWPRLTSRVAGVQVGAVMSYLASRVLGQFDPYHHAGPGPGGRLLLVAPNIVTVEREMGVNVADFRLWVCLHEETHRVQFTHTPAGGSPWLRDHLSTLIAQVVGDSELGRGALMAMARAAVSRLRGPDRGELSLIDLVQTASQRELLDRLGAIMSLLEGHAEVIMDEAGQEAIPSVRRIRTAFDRRRRARGSHPVLRRLLGMEAKLRQYRDGAAFCRAVLAEVGMTGLNAVFDHPDSLPTGAEIVSPRAWLDRVHG